MIIELTFWQFLLLIFVCLNTGAAMGYYAANQAESRLFHQRIGYIMRFIWRGFTQGQFTSKTTQAIPKLSRNTQKG